MTQQQSSWARTHRRFCLQYQEGHDIFHMNLSYNDDPLERFISIEIVITTPWVVTTYPPWDNRRYRELTSVVLQSDLIISSLITLRLRQNGHHFANDIFKCIFMNENAWISFGIPLKFLPKGLINNILALVQIMAWRWPCDKPLSETMMVRLLTHICVTRPQWVKNLDQT